jgi:hypothetical protein
MYGHGGLFSASSELWTDKDKTTIGREAEIVQGTFDLSRATLGACFYSTGGEKLRSNMDANVTVGY